MQIQHLNILSALVIERVNNDLQILGDYGSDSTSPLSLENLRRNTLTSADCKRHRIILMSTTSGAKQQAIHTWPKQQVNKKVRLGLANDVTLASPSLVNTLYLCLRSDAARLAQNGLGSVLSEHKLEMNALTLIRAQVIHLLLGRAE